jgi:hypothetical protein
MAMRYAVLIKYLFSSIFPRYPNLPMPARLCPSLVTPEDLVLLLVGPILVLLCLVLPLLAILVRKGALLAFNISAVPFLFKG